MKRLEEIDTALNDLDTYGDAGWTERAVIESPAWQCVRELAKAALAAMGKGFALPNLGWQTYVEAEK